MKNRLKRNMSKEQEIIIWLKQRNMRILLKTSGNACVKYKEDIQQV